MIPHPQMPKVWRLTIEAERDAANGEENLLVTKQLEEIADENDEHAEISIAHELVSDYSCYASIEEDDQKIEKLQTISTQLERELDDWKAFRTSTINRHRTGSVVADISHEGHVQTFLRFCG